MKQVLSFCILCIISYSALAQNVGIGTTTPLQPLHVKGPVRLDPIGTTGNATLNMYAGTTNDFGIINFYNQAAAATPNASFGYNSINDFSFWSKGSLGVYLDDIGLGISNSVPLTKLHITNGQDAGFGANQNGAIMIGAATSSNLLIDGNEILVRNNGRRANLYLQNDSGNVLLCNNNEGNVGIATAAPASKLHILGGGNASLSTHGYLVLGATNAANLVIDNNEIMARNNGAAAKLLLQSNGGETEIGDGTGTFRFTEDGKLQRPGITGQGNLLPVGFGKVAFNGARESGTFFTSIRESQGNYRVTLLNENNMLNEEDLFTIIVTPYGFGRVFMAADVDNANSFIVRVTEFHVPYINKTVADGCGFSCDNTLASFITSFPTERPVDHGFNFVVYKN